MAITLKTMKSFVPSYRYKRRHGEAEYLVSYIPARFLKKLLKLLLYATFVLLFLSAAFIVGNFAWLILKQYAILVSTEVPPKPEVTYERLQQSIHFEVNSGVERVQNDRKSRVLETCASSSLHEPKFLSAHQKKTLYSRMFVDHKHRFTYCSVPKASCTKWKQIILKTSEIFLYEEKKIDEIFPHYDHHFKRLTDLNTMKALRVLDQYYTFTFVRDPLVRLVSAWRDKFQHHPKENRSDYVHFHHEYGRHIMKRFRKKFTPHELERGFPITFEEYINYITSFSNPEEMNEHWIPSTTLCRPCHINYNFIGTVEHQKLESEYLIDQLDISSYVPDNFLTEAGTESRDEAKLLLKDIPERKKKILIDLYHDDAALFGYNLEELLR